jgi:CelD/BcsL family acetyltransferase involved in cellulose biosynthesis
VIETLALAEWRRFDEAHPAPTFFARPAWSLALAQAFPALEPSPMRVDGVLIPFVRAGGRTLRWRELVGFPLGAYTCALRADGTAATDEEFASALATLGHSWDRIRLVPWPLAPGVSASPSWRRREHETAVIDLSAGAEAALQGLSGVSRRMAGQAKRRGIACERAFGAEAVDAYYELLSECAKRWEGGAPTFPKSLLHALVAYARDDVEIWFARHGDTIVAGGVVLFGAEEAFFWSAAMRREYATFRPSNALNVALIARAAARGVRWYNLGSSEGLPGVNRFKRDLGARPIAYAELSHARPAYALYTLLRSLYTEASA